MLSRRHRCLFIHIPRTAGGSIERALTGKGWAMERYKNIKVQHVSCLETKKIYGDKIFNSYYKFAFVRNPWGLMVSTFFWAKRIIGLKDIPFKSFIGNILLYNKQLNFIPHQAYSSQQLDHLLDENGDVMVDFIGRFENLQKDFDIVCGKIGIKKKKLPFANRTKCGHYTKYYDGETAALVAEKFKKDIECFGYKF